jgi:nitric oxide reductase activation protein
MARPSKPGCADPAERYQGFSLKSVCWGYREVFARTIEGLFDEGVIGAHREEVTQQFFGLLKNADQSCFDHVLKEFLGALNPRTRWLLDLPGIFADVVELGQELAESKLYYGIRYFGTLGEGGFGDSPEQVRRLLTHLRRLREIDEDLAVSFLSGYRSLCERLAPEELDLYVNVGLEIYARNKTSGLAFMEGTLRTSETYILSITRECRLSDVQNLLEALLGALAGTKIQVADIGQLDSDDLIERGSSVICLYEWLYLPRSIRHFDDAALNRKWYLLSCVAAAGLLEGNSFPRVHGHPEYRTCQDVVGPEPVRVNLFQVLEFTRILRQIRQRWPGARRLIDFGLRTEFTQSPPVSPADRLLRDLLLRETQLPEPARELLSLADASVNLFDTARRIDEHDHSELMDAYPGLDRCELRSMSFLPDFLYPAQASVAPSDALIADLKNAAAKQAEGEEADRTDTARSAVTEGDSEEPEDQQDSSAGPGACYVYDEWSHEENDYYRDFCFVYEAIPADTPDRAIPADIAQEARRAARVFEQFRPDLAQRDKRLAEGEVINPDLLLEYLVQRRREPAPRVEFYEKPRVNRRDLAVLILLDSSGSTGESVGDHRKVIDVEKHAGLILGQGLASLGDRFGICGFSSNGRENCHYFVYKDFDQPWDRQSIARVLAASPAESTRIGPALRHSGYRLGGVEAHQRLIIVVTDGKPMDSGYDPNTRYAQHDIRMANEENARMGIHTFGISTEANTVADMEIMFPRRRFAILPDIRKLPRILPQLYIRLTA